MRFSTITTLAVGLAFGVVARPSDAAQAATQDVQQDEADYIVNEATGTVLDLYNGGSAVGTPIYGWASGFNNNDHQIWVTMCAGPNKQVQIVNMKTGVAAGCYYAPGVAYGTLVAGNPEVNGLSKFYEITNDDGSTTFESVRRYNGKAMCIDLYQSNSASKTPVICYPCHYVTGAPGSNQMWTYKSIPKATLQSYNLDL